MSWDVSTLRADHGDAAAFRVEARDELVEVLVTNTGFGSEIAPVILDPGENHPSRWAETESRVASDERLDAPAELVGEGCHGGSFSWWGCGGTRNRVAESRCSFDLAIVSGSHPSQELGEETATTYREELGEMRQIAVTGPR